MGHNGGAAQRVEKRLQRGRKLDKIDRMNRPVVGGACFDGARRRAFVAMACEDEDRQPGHARAQSGNDRERVGAAVALHEFDNEQHRDIRTELIDRQVRETRLGERIGIELHGRPAHHAGKLQAQFEIVMDHQAQLARAGGAASGAGIALGGCRVQFRRVVDYRCH